MDAARISDDEIVYRRIPCAAPWFEDPEQITTANFKLNRRRGDLGLSVYRAAMVTPEEALAKANAAADSLVAAANVGDIRALCNGRGEPLALDVVAVDDEHDVGHAEIRGAQLGKLSSAASGALHGLFKRI
ncbi:MAG TPA: hypothetical protein VMV69_29600 [Pirellulales bacterium]|nr:hypothetical protein [Pirellulales bacterium]